MSVYTQLTREQRYQIQALLKTDQNQTQIATVVGVHKTTISRELRRNCGLRGYRPHQAHCLAQARQATKIRSRVAQTTWQQVETLVRQGWSPEQISAWLRHYNQSRPHSTFNGQTPDEVYNRSHLQRPDPEDEKQAA